MPLVQNAVSYAVGKWIEKDHPRLESGHCVDIKQKTIKCGACAAICPTGATLDARTRNWDECIDCNLCAAVCPTRALRSSAMNIDRFLHATESSAAEITIGCEQCEDGDYLQMYCMGGIPWEVFANIALDKRVILDTSHCADCAEVEGKKQFQRALKQAREFLGAEYFDKHFGTVGKKGAGGVSRREAFSFLQNVGRNVAENLLNRPGGTPIEGLFFRDELSYRIDNPTKDAVEALKDHVYTLRIPSFNDNCWACNICKNICPERAISIEHDEDEREYYVQIDPMACTACGLCKTACRDSGIDGMISYKTQEPTLKLLVLAHPSVCDTCGKNFKPNGSTTCISCIRAAERKEKAARMKVESAERAAKVKAAREAAAASLKVMIPTTVIARPEVATTASRALRKAASLLAGEKPKDAAPWTIEQLDGLGAALCESMAQMKQNATITRVPPPSPEEVKARLAAEAEERRKKYAEKAKESAERAKKAREERLAREAARKAEKEAKAAEVAAATETATAAATSHASDGTSDILM